LNQQFPLPMGNMFQDPQRMPETKDSSELCTHYVFHILYHTKVNAFPS
jgi:hypothetical protein